MKKINEKIKKMEGKEVEDLNKVETNNKMSN